MKELPQFRREEETMNLENIALQQGSPVTRWEIYMPHMSFAEWEDRINKLTPAVYCTWMKLWISADRKTQREIKGDIVPRSIQNLAAYLEMSEMNLRRHLKPLYNFGLIDFVEHAEAKRSSQKPVNIVVYPYPFYDKQYRDKPLEELRNYDTDYSSKAKKHGEAGARRKREIKIFEKVNQEQRQRISMEPIMPIPEDPAAEAERLAAQREIDVMQWLDYSDLPTFLQQGIVNKLKIMKIMQYVTAQVLGEARSSLPRFNDPHFNEHDYVHDFTFKVFEIVTEQKKKAAYPPRNETAELPY